MKEGIPEIGSEEYTEYYGRLLFVIVTIVIFLFGGAAFYSYVEHWRYLDALYFSAFTLTTVGYGDITPQTDVGKIFTIVYMFSGVGVVLYGLSVIATHFVEMRERFWLQRLGKIRISRHTETFWDKIMYFLGLKKRRFSYRTY